MSRFIDYKCKTGADTGGVAEEVVKEIDMDFPEAYTTAIGMVKIAKANKEFGGFTTCLLPFCHTVEAENYGGNINLGSAKIGPRCGGYVYENIQELLNLPDLDFSKGRLYEVIKGIEELKSDGENVSVNITGPITILNNLIEPRKLFKAWRKEPDTVADIVDKIRLQLLIYIEKAIQAGADIICFEDPVGGVNILGPKFFEIQGKNFSHPFVIEALKLTDKQAILHICPKTTLQLISLELAEWNEIELEEEMTYEEAYLKFKDQRLVTGNICVHNRNVPLRNKKLRVLKPII